MKFDTKRNTKICGNCTDQHLKIPKVI